MDKKPTKEELRDMSRDVTGPPEVVKEKKSKAAKPAPKTRRIMIDESGSVEVPEGEPYGLERPIRGYKKGGMVTKGQGRVMRKKRTKIY